MRDHPSPQALAALARREGPEPDRLATLDHVMSCADCRPDFDLLRAIEGAGDDGAAAGRAGMRRRWLMPAALAASLLLAVGVGRSLLQSHADTSRGDGDAVSLIRPGLEAVEGDSLAFAWHPVPGAGATSSSCSMPPVPSRPRPRRATPPRRSLRRPRCPRATTAGGCAPGRPTRARFAPAFALSDSSPGRRRRGGPPPPRGEPRDWNRRSRLAQRDPHQRISHDRESRPFCRDQHHLSVLSVVSVLYRGVHLGVAPNNPSPTPIRYASASPTTRLITPEATRSPVCQPHEPPPGVRERPCDRRGDEHHPGDRPDAEHQQVEHRPVRCSRSCVSTSSATAADPASPCTTPTTSGRRADTAPCRRANGRAGRAASARGCADAFGLVAVQVGVDVVAVAVRMQRVTPSSPLAGATPSLTRWSTPLRFRAPSTISITPTENSERQAHPRRDDPAQEDDAAADGQDGQRVADAPGAADQRGAPRPPVAGRRWCVTAITWSGSVACRMPRKNPSATIDGEAGHDALPATRAARVRPAGLEQGQVLGPSPRRSAPRRGPPPFPAAPAGCWRQRRGPVESDRRGQVDLGDERHVGAC